MLYDNLRLTCCDGDGFRKHSYWYLITSRGTSHTAFRTREGLMGWLHDRWLNVAVPEGKGVFSVHTIEGSYTKKYVWSVAELSSKVGSKGITLDKGDYTDCVFVNADGFITEYLCNPNVKDRVVYDSNDGNIKNIRR